jgi:hypothetical protein
LKNWDIVRKWRSTRARRIEGPLGEKEKKLPGEMGATKDLRENV